MKPARNPPAVVDRLCRENLRLVTHIARTLYSPLGIDEHISLGNLGLVEAARRYDFRDGVKFSSYAARYIKEFIRNGIVRESGVHHTNDQRKLFWRIKRAVASGARTPEDIAAACDVAVECVKQHSEHLLRGIVSLDAPLRYQDGENHTVGERLVGDDSLLARLEGDEAYRRILEAMDRLPPRLRYVIERRFCDDDVRLLDLALELDLSRERIRQLEKRALLALRAILSDKPAPAEQPKKFGVRAQQRRLREAKLCIDCGNKSRRNRRCYRCRDIHAAVNA